MRAVFDTGPRTVPHSQCRDIGARELRVLRCLRAFVEPLDFYLRHSACRGSAPLNYFSTTARSGALMCTTLPSEAPRPSSTRGAAAVSVMLNYAVFFRCVDGIGVFRFARIGGVRSGG